MSEKERSNATGRREEIEAQNEKKSGASDSDLPPRRTDSSPSKLDLYRCVTTT